MSEEAKIHLSTFETELVNETQWIFTKQIIIEKVSRLLGALQVRYKNLLENNKDVPEELLLRQGAKISKGENYNGLPYLILDYPAIFGKENVCAVRTMFWWANYFSISLHLSGRFFVGQKNLDEWLLFLKGNNFFVCINENEWEHHFSALNYLNANELTDLQITQLHEKSFFKVGKKIALTQWESAPEFLEKTFKEMIALLTLAT
ncbi:MAG TPA: hypothetical protein VIJ75_04805 [Hanamia sp.]